jgi:Glycosyl hydrolase 108
MEATFLANTVVRIAPGVGSAMIKIAPKGSKAEVLDDLPQQVGQYRWRKLRHADETVGWSADFLLRIEQEAFEKAVRFTLSWEGGYVSNPNDPGGETKYGISKRAYPHLDIKNLTLDQAKEIYYQDYWLPSEAPRQPYPKSLILFDIAVLTGVGRAKTLSSLTSLEILHQQYSFFTQLTNFTHFGRGWIRRTTALLELLL